MLRWKAHRGKVAALSFSRDGAYLASVSGTSRDVFIWQAITGTLVRKLDVADVDGRSDYSAAADVSFAPDADRLAVARKHWVEVWDTANWVRLAEREYRFQMPGHVEIGPGENPLVAASTSRETVIYKLRPPNWEGGLISMCAWNSHNHTQLSFTPDGSGVATHTTDDVEVRDTSNGKLRRELKHARGAYCGPVRFSPDGTRLAFCSTKTIESWPSALDNLSAVVKYVGHKTKVWVLRYTPDGRTLISASADDTVRMWEADTGAERRCFAFDVGKYATVAVSPDGTVAAAGGAAGEIVVWDLD
jgi:WD40 repeat protein